MAGNIAYYKGLGIFCNEIWQGYRRRKADAAIKPSRKQFLLFTAAGFGPAILLAGMLLAGAILNFSLVLFAREISELGSVLLLTGTVLGCLFLLILLSIGCCRIFYLIHSGILRFLLLFTANLVMVFVFLFLFVRVLGGASMAVVDGAVSSSELRGLSIQAALPLLALAQLVIVPWVLVAVVVLNRIAFRGKQDEQQVS